MSGSGSHVFLILTVSVIHVTNCIDVVLVSGSWVRSRCH